ncbi:MAG: redoxin domain-containing protein [Myxococcales bacterium]|nr:redoxin domain-containing protein [Myxococcales bacterium]
MKHWLFLAWLAVAASPPLQAREDDSVNDDSVSAVKSDYFATLRSNSAKAKKDLPAGVQAPSMSESELQVFIDRCQKIYDVSAGEPAEFDALSQILALTSDPYVKPTSEKSLQAWRDCASKLFTDFIDDDRMATFVMNFPSPAKAKAEAAGYATKLIRSNNVAVKAAAAYLSLSQRADAAGDTPLTPELETKLLADLATFGQQFGMVDSVQGGTYAEWTKNTSYALVNLKVGGMAPEIEAPDLDGVKFKLSDYRGKVVLIDFWGYW